MTTKITGETVVGFETISVEVEEGTAQVAAEEYRLAIRTLTKEEE